MNIRIIVQDKGTQFSLANTEVQNVPEEQVTKIAKAFRNKVCERIYGRNTTPAKLTAYIARDAETGKILGKSDNFSF